MAGSATAQCSAGAVRRVLVAVRRGTRRGSPGCAAPPRGAAGASAGAPGRCGSRRRAAGRAPRAGAGRSRPRAGSGRSSHGAARRQRARRAAACRPRRRRARRAASSQSRRVPSTVKPSRQASRREAQLPRWASHTTLCRSRSAKPHSRSSRSARSMRPRPRAHGCDAEGDLGPPVAQVAQRDGAAEALDAGRRRRPRPRSPTPGRSPSRRG